MCLLCPECQIPMEEVTAWARCGHCGKLLTRLGPVQQEPQYYTLNLLTGLCVPQPWRTQMVGEGQGSLSRGGEVLRPSDPPAKIKNICGEEEAAANCGLATARASVQEPDDIPEEPASSKSLAVPVRKEPMLEGGVPPGDLVEVREGQVID